METLYVNRDARISREDMTLVVTTNSGKRRVPVKTLRQVVILGEAGLTTSVLNLLGRSDVRVTVLDWHGNVTGSYEPAGSPAAGRVRLAQARAVLDPAARLLLARAFVEGAVGNILSNLRYRAYRGSDVLRATIAEIEGRSATIAAAEDIPALMGAEGLVRAAYYTAWRAVDPRLDFGRRVRRPPNNPVNCLISWFNGLAYSAVRAEIAKSHLDNCLSFLHSPQEARASLALDLGQVIDPQVEIEPHEGSGVVMAAQSRAAQGREIEPHEGSGVHQRDARDCEVDREIEPHEGSVAITVEHEHLAAPRG